ncbi:hypothetical protein [Escherichia coli]|uniref:hypothetical protein n=1 Tax=Escherichia coli TaxID=562 RepID=UPI000D174BC9|nr:hypothetical protein [Escherichia coli]PSY01165.1 hypothetical protein C7U74_27445 [Escherichia coli]
MSAVTSCCIGAHRSLQTADRRQRQIGISDSTYSVQSDEFDDQTTYTQYRYFSTAIPEDIRRFMFYVDYCFVDLAFDIETDSMTAKNDIINECTPLKERNKTLKEKYKK